MTAENRPVRRVIAALETLGIPYMVTGSLASSHHGRPRSTHDVDVVIDPAPELLAELVRELVAVGFYADHERARQALRRRTQFNVIDGTTGVKIDLILRKDRAFSHEEMRRRRRSELPGVGQVAMATAEDSILSKLEWALASGGSERQLADIAGIVDVQGASLDRKYVEHWAEELGVGELWRRLVAPDRGSGP